jgi:hypothetical protein
MTDLPRDTEQELAALADGSLTGERAEQAEVRVSDSPELRVALAEQRRAVELTSAVDVRAPASLQRQVESMFVPARGGSRSPSVRGRRSPGARGRFSPARVGLGAATAAVCAALAIVLIGGSAKPSPSLNVQRAAALTLGPATMAAPTEDGTHRTQLDASVDGVSFPYWEEHFGWRSSGARDDRVGGQVVRTVFYSSVDGRRIGYAIASGPAPRTSGGTVVRRWGVSYRLLARDGATVIAWQRAGHLCVMAGRGVSTETLLSLASWGAKKPHAA